MGNSAVQCLPASFRDPAGYVFRREGEILRAVTAQGAADYTHFMQCGLGAALTQDNLLLGHVEMQGKPDGWPDVLHVLRPEQLEFVSYPYEWCFSQLKDAALLTLEIQRRALEKGMSLKDASAFNVQFRGGQPVFIDTLSFERDEGGPWAAYEQFCRHFLAPLLLMKTVSPDIGRLLSGDLGGIGLALASRMLGWRTYLSAGALLHVHLHARAITAQYPAGGMRKPEAGRQAKPGLTESLRRAVEGTRLPRSESEWSGYEDHLTHYGAEALEAKSKFVEEAINRTPRGLVYDVGGNTGLYSRMAAAAGHLCVLFDADIACVERAYRRGKEANESRILPLRLDVSNPTPALGVNLCERSSLFERPKAGLVMALALVHHLRLRENIPFGMMADFFSRLGERLLIEWVGPEDEKASVMLAAKKMPPADYNLSAFLDAFSSLYRLTGKLPLAGMDRQLLLFECMNSTKP